LREHAVGDGRGDCFEGGVEIGADDDGVGFVEDAAAQGRALGVYQNGGYGTHVVAPHPRHLVDPGSLDLGVAATYACSGITVYSAIKKIMPIAPDEPVSYAAEQLVKHDISRLPVINGEKLVGIVDRHDILTALA